MQSDQSSASSLVSKMRPSDLAIHVKLSPNGHNFADWSYLLSSMLDLHGDWIADPSGKSLGSPKATTRSLAAINYNIDASLIGVIRHSNGSLQPTAESAWSTLYSRWGVVNINAGISALESLISFKFGSIQDIVADLDRATNLEHQLISGLKSDTIKVSELVPYLLLLALPASFSDYKTRILMDLKQLADLTNFQRDVVTFSKIIPSNRLNAHLTATGIGCVPHGYSPESRCFKCHPDLICQPCKHAKEGKFAHVWKSKYCKHPEEPAEAPGLSNKAASKYSLVHDSGASRHYSHCKSWLHNYVEFVEPLLIHTANDEVVYALGEGDVPLIGTYGPLTLFQVLYVPSFSTNLVSANELDKAGFRQIITNGKILILSGNATVATGTFNAKLGLYTLDLMYDTVSKHTQLTALMAKPGRKSEGLDNTSRNKLGGSTSGIPDVPGAPPQRPTGMDVDLHIVTGKQLNHTTTKPMKKIPIKWQQLHLKLNHLHGNALKEAANYWKLQPTGSEDLSDCQTCIVGKLPRGTFHTTTHHIATRAGEQISGDICKISVTSTDGFEYFLVLVDEFSRYTTVYLLKTKDELTKRIQEFLVLCHTKFNRHVVYYRTDNEARTTSLQTFCAQLTGTSLQFTAPYTSQQNGMAERAIRTLCDGMRCALAQSGLPTSHWDDAVLYASYSRNCTPRNNSSPFELWHGKPVPYTHLRIFGETVYAKLHDHERRGKTFVKALPYTFIGYSPDQKALRLKDPNSSLIIVRSFQDIKFLSTFIAKSPHVTMTALDEYVYNQYNQIEDATYDPDSDTNSVDTSPLNILNADNESEYFEPDVLLDDLNAPEILLDEPYIVESNLLPVEHEPNQLPVEQKAPDFSKISESNIIDGSRRRGYVATLHIPKTGTEWDRLERSYNFAFKTTVASLTYKDAHQGLDSQKWLVAEEEELDKLRHYGVFDVVTLPTNMKAIGCRYVYTSKNGVFKARLCAKGFSQLPGIDFDNTWAPVANYDSMRLLFSLVAKWDFDMIQMDVTSAFLNAPIDKNIFMRPPPGYLCPVGHVFHLKKALYGLKQGPCLWHATITTFLKSINLEPLKSDPCILTSGNINSPDFVAVILFVDDLKIFGQTISITKVKAALSSEYDMKTLNTNDSYVGFEILRNRTQKTLKLSQTKFTKQIIQDLLMYQPDEYMCTTPMDPKVKHLPFEGTATVEDIRRYQTAIGNLGYLVIGTRPDIAYSYSILNQFVSNPGKLHWDAVLKIYRYLATTPGKGIVFGTAEWQPSAYCDANHGGHVTDNVSIAPRSHSGYIFLASGGPFAWKSKRQSRTVPSSFDSEAIALRIATIQARYFKNFYHELGLTINPIQIREDNTSVIKCTTTPRHALTKASNSDFHIIRESIAANEITLEFVKSKDNIADCLTKPLFGPSIQRFNKLMGVV